MNSQIKKWGGVALSFIVSTFGMYVISMPIWAFGMWFGQDIIHNPQGSPAMGYIVLYGSIWLPFLLSLFFVYRNLNQSILGMISADVDTSNAKLLEPSMDSEDEKDNKIIQAFNKAKEKLNFNKDIKLVRVKDNEIVNAFALSNLKGESGIVVFDGIVDKLNDEELQAAIGHEIGHIKNKDSLLTVTLYASQYTLPILENISYKLMNFINEFAQIHWVLALTMKFFYLCYRLSIYIYVIPAKWLANMINTLQAIKEMEGVHSQNKSFIDFLASTHPPTEKRIIKLQKGI